MTKKELCNVDLIPIPTEKMRKEYHEYCPMSESNNIVFCPKKIIERKKDKKVQWINDYFKKFEKKIKNKQKEQKEQNFPFPYSDSKLTQPLPQYTVHRTLNRIILRNFSSTIWSS